MMIPEKRYRLRLTWDEMKLVTGVLVEAGYHRFAAEIPSRLDPAIDGPEVEILRRLRAIEGVITVWP